ETIETCWKIASSGGISASVTAICTRVQLVSQCSRPMRPTVTYMITATAPKESQNPGASTAQGSTRITTKSATHSTADADSITPSHKAAATTANMYTVRWAGTAKPASSA